MTEKRFDFKYDGVGYSYYLCDKEEGASYEDRVFAEIWADKSEVEDIVNKMNALHEENQSLKKENLQLLALLGDIRALLRTNNTDTAINKINQIEKNLLKK